MKQINSFLTQLQGYVNLGVISIKTKVARGIRFNFNKIICIWHSQISAFIIFIGVEKNISIKILHTMYTKSWSVIQNFAKLQRKLHAEVSLKEPC